MDRQKLIEDNLKLVYKIATKYKYLCCTTVDYEDLVSIGTIGLIKAAGAYDEAKNIKFSTLAFICIKNSILREFIHKQYRINDKNTLSLEQPIGDDIYLKDTISDIDSEDFLEDINNNFMLGKIYNNCSNTEKTIIDLFLAGKSLKEISIKIGCCQATVSKILSSLKRYAGGEMSMKLSDSEVECPYCFGRLGDDINGKIHIKYCEDCGKWWETYPEGED